MNTFTIEELKILYNCIQTEIRTTENPGIGYECVLEHLADKLTELRLIAGDKFTLHTDINRL